MIMNKPWTMRRIGRVFLAVMLALALAQAAWAQAGAEGGPPPVMPGGAPPAPGGGSGSGRGLDTVLTGGITVNNEDIQDVLTILAQFTGLSMFATKAVVGRVSFSFPQDVTVRQVLESVLPGYGWTYRFDSNAGTVNIMTLAEVPKDEAVVYSKIFTLRNISPDRIMPIIQSKLSPVGKATVIPGTRDIQVEDILEVLSLIEKLMPSLDRDRVTHVFQLEFLTVEEAQAALEGIISAEHGDIQTKPELGILIVTDIEENIRRAIAIIDVLDVDPLETLVVPINFADPSAVLDAVTPILTPEAYTYYDERTSRIILRDIRSKIAIAAEIIKAMDIPPLQVYVEGELFAIQDSDAFEIGVQWETGEQVRNTVQNETQSVFSGALRANALATLFGGGIFNLAYLDPQDFSVAINALRQNDNTRTLLSPRILVVNDEMASLHEGTREPYAVRSRSNTIEGDDFISQRTQEVGTKLQIEPHISENGYIDVLVEIEDSDTLPPRNQETADLLRTRETRAETVVTIKSGRTIVIGGLIRKRSSWSRSGVPVLSQVPLLGLLFRNKSERESFDKLVVFITPHIVSVDDPYKISWTDEINWDKRLKKSLYDQYGKAGDVKGATEPAEGIFFTTPSELPPEVIEWIKEFESSRRSGAEPSKASESGEMTVPEETLPEGLQPVEKEPPSGSVEIPGVMTPPSLSPDDKDNLPSPIEPTSVAPVNILPATAQ